jgi:hypothetical protein
LKRLYGQHGPVVGHSKIFVSTKNKNFKFQLINYCVIFKSKKKSSLFQILSSTRSIKFSLTFGDTSSGRWTCCR